MVPALAIVGTAGRKGSHLDMTLETFLKMNFVAHEFAQQLMEHYKVDTIKLISGGAAWADHVAVSLFRHHPDLYTFSLYGPCRWDSTHKRFLDNGLHGWRDNPGSAANYFHHLFWEQTAIESLAQIDDCHDKEAFTYGYEDGFLARNRVVARNSSHLLAFTFGEGSVPTDGGTLHTWNTAMTQGVVCTHMSIPSL